MNACSKNNKFYDFRSCDLVTKNCGIIDQEQQRTLPKRRLLIDAVTANGVNVILF